MRRLHEESFTLLQHTPDLFVLDFQKSQRPGPVKNLLWYYAFLTVVAALHHHCHEEIGGHETRERRLIPGEDAGGWLVTIRNNKLDRPFFGVELRDEFRMRAVVG